MKKLLQLAVLVTLSCLAHALAADAVPGNITGAAPAKSTPAKSPAVDTAKCQPEKPVALSATPAPAAPFCREITKRLHEQLDKKFEQLIQQQLDQEAAKLLP